MEGFKKLPKMQSFKTGGSVKAMCYGGKMKNGGHAEKKEMKADVAQDKALVKKGVRQHEGALHKGSPKTELKLKTGGRVKKEAGNVKKFDKASGQYGAKKTAEDKKAIKEAKLFKPAKFKNGGKACYNEGGSLKPVDGSDNPGLAKLPTNVRNKMGYMRKGGDVSEAGKKSGDKDATVKTKMCSSKASTKSAAMKKGGKVKKFNEGRSVDVKDPQALTDKIAREENAADRELVMKPLRALKDMAVGAAKKLSGQGAVYDKERQDVSNINKKKGGKIKKYADGGSVFSDDETQWLGGADRTDPIILARMRAALGPKKPAVMPQGSYMPNANPAMDNRDVGMVEGIKPQGAYIPNANPIMDNRDVGMTARRPAPRPAPRPMPSAPVRPETSADLDPYGTTRKETSADLDPYGNAGTPKPYIDIPQRAAGMQQFKQDATSPAGDFWNWLTTNSYKNQRNKRRG
jgi:hypothetical protein